MKIIILDLETTGLPDQPCWGSYYPYQQLPYYNISRIVQIGMLVYKKKINGKFILEKEFDLLIKPDGFKINNASIHGITHKMADEKGIKFKDAVNLISNLFKQASLLVAHNALFDTNILKSELFRYGMSDELKEFNKIPIFCTSSGCVEITKIVMKKSKKYKHPKLIELYRYLFNSDPIESLHNAANDAKILADCFFELLSKKLIEL